MKSKMMIRLFPWLGVATALLAAPIKAQETSQSSSAPAPAAEELAKLVESFVARDEIVGAELLVVHDGKPILHRAFGFSDRESKKPMQRDQYFAVRSMTKPLTGMAAQILIDEGKLALDAPVARYLPAFDTEKSRGITVEQLLTHRAGFPFFQDPGKSSSAIAGGLSDLANRAGERGPLHAPGTRFVYSDVGSDVLGALIVATTGAPLEVFIRDRILNPLRLDDIFPEAEAATPPRRDRVPTRYLGVAGHWTAYWSVERPPLYPFLKGSGGLYATASDYARFLQAWMDGEAGPAGKVLSRDAFARALKPSSTDVLSTGFVNARCDYGQMWTLYAPRSAPEKHFAFGHGGSDGTHAYAFPEHKLIVCYFTQTRGNETALRFEAALSHLFLQPNAAAFAQLLTPAQPPPLAEFVGLYAPQNRAAALGAIVALNGTLAFEIPGRMWLRLRATDDRDRWVPERAPNDAVVFRRADGRVVGLTLHRGERVDDAPRFQPDAALPSADELMSLRMRAVPPDAVAALRTFRVRSELETEGGKLNVVSIYEANGRSFTEIDLGAPGKMRFWSAGERVWKQMPGAETATELHGLERAEQWANLLSVEMGDWRKLFREVIVLSREEFAGEHVFRVRLVPKDGLAVTKLVSLASGRVLATYGFTVAAGPGSHGMETRHREFREVDGLQLPFADTVVIPSLGAKVVARVVEFTPHVEIKESEIAPAVVQRERTSK